MNRTTKRARLAATVGAAALTATLLTGCAQELPTPVAGDEAAAPVLSKEQEARVLDSVRTVLETAQTNNDPEVLKQRLSGPALDLRTKQIHVAQARGDASMVTTLPMEAIQVVPSTTTTWPRTSFVVSNVPEDLTPQRFMAFDQANARDPYKLWGWVQLIPNTVLPTFAKPEYGAEALAPDDASLVAAPKDAVAQYADVLNLGDGSQYAPGVAIDTYREFVNNNAATQNQALQAAPGSTYTMQFTPTEDAPRTMRTLDGGAIVMGRLNALETYNGPAGSKIGPPTPTTQALFGSNQQTNVLKISYISIVALYVPPAGSTDQVQLVGWTHVAEWVANG